MSLQLKRAVRPIRKPNFECLEDRKLMAALIPGVTLDPLLVPKFVNPLPQLLAPNSVYQPTGTTQATLQDSTIATVPLYTVGAYQTSQSLGLGTYGALKIAPPVGKRSTDPVVTNVYGYGSSSANATYPGRTFEVQSGAPIAVNWVDGLTSNQHLLPVDPTVLDMTANGMMSYNVSTGTVPNTPQTGTTQAANATFTAGIPLAPHVHGGHTQAAYDGTPMQWFTTNPGISGEDYVGGNWVYDNTQQSASLWYHDHAMGITRLNVYAGLAGFYIVHDVNENNLVSARVLPNKAYDIPLVIQDRLFDTKGQLYYPADVLKGTTATYPSIHPEFFGDTILVNGKAWPVMDVEPRKYRFRILDGSQARFYNLKLNVSNGSTQPFLQIGSDDGLLAKPVTLDQMLMAPGERNEIVIDFSKLAGKTVTLVNDAKGPYPKGTPVDPKTTGQILLFRVNQPKSAIPDATVSATSVLNTIARYTAGPTPTQLSLLETVDGFNRLAQFLGTPTGGYKPFMPDPMNSMANAENITLDPVTGTATVTWQVYNTSMDVHPIHLHQVAFQVIQRQNFTATLDPATGRMSKITLKGSPMPPSANEMGWKDTVQMYPGTVTTIVAKFDLPGKYVWHCHILEHEEHDMMHWLNIIKPAAPVMAPVLTTSSTNSSQFNKTYSTMSSGSSTSVGSTVTTSGLKTSSSLTAKAFNATTGSGGKSTLDAKAVDELLSLLTPVQLLAPLTVR